ncbi:ADP-heptose:LPS heptosyltransferase [Duganella sacchari]|uniref:ADP-heptose:LPS heptosyltransferase n=1 Tax=Duganella sacchari TaxID=551987 RepID=A0A1M7RBL3_9BURK|nr:glycosyltransferase family 9 protein [Duganella sacchari]SHN43705.1 ADP-heptose:LPS heptosyltransferase [Duganella sacchari]
MKQLISAPQLAQAKKILVITHMAIGDFTYMQMCFRALKRAYPHLAIDLWVDERRRTDNPAEWPHLKNYSLFDWLAASPYIDKTYTETYSPALYAQSIAAAQREDYPLVVSFTHMACHRYARLAREISPRGYIVGLKKHKYRFFELSKILSILKFNATIPLYESQEANVPHVSDIYAQWFTSAFGLSIPPQDRYPDIHIPDQWMDYARQQLADWKLGAKVVFVNAYSKGEERCWPLERVFALIEEMRSHASWQDAGFIINVVPEELPAAQALYDKMAMPGTHLFSAVDNFFQLPAILSLCSLIVTVETAVMHLANAVHVPVIALMRQNNPEWVPIDRENSTVIHVRQFGDWVDKIGLPEVMEKVLARPLC